MNCRFWRWILISNPVLLALWIPPSVHGQDPGKAPDKVHKVAREPFKVEVSIEGVLEAREAHEVSIQPETWAEWTVLEAVEHGARVRKGELLVAIDHRKIEEAIEDLESGRELAVLSLAQSEEEVRALEDSLALDQAAAERAKVRAAEDLKIFLDIGRAFSERSAQESYKSTSNFLEYQKEELRQLEKMYKADDLTEETEEIILKRQRDSVERAVFNLERAKKDLDQTLKIDLPRQEENLKESARRQEMALEKARTGLPLALNKKRLDLEKQKRDIEKSDERLAKLRKDREAMEVRSPADGIVYYGKSTRGSWPPAATAGASLNRGGSLRANDVFITVVRQFPMVVRAAVPEKELHHLRPGLEGRAAPAGFPEVKLAVKLESISPIPVAPGSFDARLEAHPGREAEALMPGMACTVRLTPYLRTDALVVPAAAVFADPLDEEKLHVFRVGENGKHEKRAVEAGRRSAGKVEILEGLAEGDSILLESPEAKK